MTQLAATAPNSERRSIFGLEFTPLTLKALVGQLLHAPAKEAQMIVTCNLDHVVNLHRDPMFRAAYKTAWQTTVDGTPVFLYQRLRGGRATERVTGADMLPALMHGFDPTRHRPFFLTANDEVGRGLEDDLRSRGYDFDVTPYFTVPFGFERDPAISDTVLAKIRAAAPTHLFLGVGSPKSEKWIAQYRDQLGAMYILPIGAALEFHTGHKLRAPKIMRRIGLEGAWRLFFEPRRLWQRYMIDSWAFLAAVGDDLRSGNTVVKR